MARSRRGWCLAAVLVLSLPAAACTTSRPLPRGERYISINYPVWASDDEMMSGMRAQAARTCPGYRVVAARVVPIGNGQPKHIEAIIDCTSPLPAVVLNDKVERLVRYIVVKDADEVRRIHDNVARGQDFAIAARASLDERTRDRGGEVGYVVYSQMNPAIGDVIFHLPVGHVSEPIHTNQGWEIYEVLDERPVPAKAPPRHGPPSAAGISGADGEEKGLKLYGSGSGFFISKTGALLTNNHVVDGCKAMRADIAGVRVKGHVLRTDPVNDLAVILFDTTPAAVASFRDGPYVRPGDSVVAAGFPLPDVLAPELNVTTGAVSSLAGLGGNSAFVQMTAPVQPGNSGGPLLDASGDVVGVVESKLNAIRIAAATGDIPENINFAVKSSVARSFLEDAGYEPKLARSTRTLSAADVGDMARAFTVRVECWK